MLLKPVLAVSILLGGAWAQSTDSYEATTTEEPSATAKETGTQTWTTSTGTTTHTIAVGASGHKFTPAEVKAKVGDVIEWRFYPPNHWVIRGDFDNPCIPYEYVGTDRTGFSSGEQDVQAITDDGPRFRVRVNDTEPIFFYCGAPGSCVRYHMMGVINPSKNETLEDWTNAAKDVDYQLRPGDPWPSESGFSKPSDAVSESGAPSNDGDDKSDHDHSSHGLGAGAIAGIAIGGAAVLLLAGAMIYLCGRRGGFDKAYRKSFRNSSAPAYTPAPPAVSESQFSSPNIGTANIWAATKQPASLSAYPQNSTPVSPQHTGVNYNFPPGFNPVMVQDGTMASYYSDQPVQHVAVPPQTVTPIPSEQPAPAELPASTDPGNSPLPAYDNTRNVDEQRTFSWAGEETAYRPAK
ncbi:hypothetical protein BGZ63DRAFT_455376 [Mariannaea sp. PMI_226]|nr:hypothetical protein BGZ63DRAFT_455376 [Mariannaea sp. PMI_226]